METEMLNVKLKDRIHNTMIRQRTRVTDIVEYVTNEKWKWAGHIAQVKGNGRTTRSKSGNKGHQINWKTIEANRSKRHALERLLLGNRDLYRHV